MAELAILTSCNLIMVITRECNDVDIEDRMTTMMTDDSSYDKQISPFAALKMIVVIDINQ